MAFGRTHPREVDAVAGLPVTLAQVLQVQGHHRDICPPVLQSYQHAHTYLVHPGLPHAVKAVDSPFKLRFHPRRVVYVVILPVVGLLEADHPVES